jgi:hypothetical protein
MPNRYHSNFNGKLSGKSGPKNSSGAAQPSLPKESTMNWPKAPGETRPSPNKVKFPEIKQAVKSS